MANLTHASKNAMQKIYQLLQQCEDGIFAMLPETATEARQRIHSKFHAAQNYAHVAVAVYEPEKAE